ncbi:MAG TPA: GNAT family N-acetyltransferase [Acidimicrobiales bacterium]
MQLRQPASIQKGPIMETAAKLRPGTPDDAEVCGQICFDAFGAIATAHGFPSDFPTPQIALGLLSMLLAHPGFYGVVAETGGRVVGSNFLDERAPILGIGPITVAPDAWDRGIGRILMNDVLGRASERSAPGVRLVQTAYHNRSLALYAELGFQVRDLLACVQGPPIGAAVSGYTVRPATIDDVESCDELCRRVHGHHRGGEVADAIAQGSALVAEHDGRITGYSTGVAFFGHSVAESNEGLKALIGATHEFAGPGILVPTSNGDLLRWCLAHGLRVVELMTLMSIGLFNEPAGAYLPSVLY